MRNDFQWPIVFYLDPQHPTGVGAEGGRRLQGVELREGTDAVLMVGYAACLAATVHAEDGIAHIDTTQGDRGGQDVAQGATACHIAVVDEALAGHTRLAADLGEDGSRDGVAGILLGGVELDGGTSTEHGVVGRVVLLGVVGMEGVGIVGGDHEGALHRLPVGFLRATLLTGNTHQHRSQEGAASTLLGLRSRLLVVEDGEHLGGVALGSCNQSLESGKAHRQVVEAARGDKLVVDAEGAGGLRVGQVEVEVEDVLVADGALLAEFLDNDVHQQVALLQFVVDQSQEGKHILLLAQFHAVVDLAVEVDGEVADLEQRTTDVHQHCLGRHGILATHDDAASERQRTVEPCGEDRATIDLGVQAHQSALTRHLGMGLHAECGGVAMGANHVESRLGQRFATQAEGIDRRVVLRHIDLVASLQFAEGLLRVKAAVTVLLEFTGYVARGEEIDGRRIQKFQ